MIRIGPHLHRTGDQYRVDFMPDEVKTDRHLTQNKWVQRAGAIRIFETS
jgi:hypothetical protein